MRDSGIAYLSTFSVSIQEMQTIVVKACLAVAASTRRKACPLVAPLGCVALFKTFSGD